MSVQAAGFAGHQRGCVARADGEDGVVRCARSPGRGYLQTWPGGCYLSQFHRDGLLPARRCDRAGVERPASDVMEVGLDGAVDAGAGRAVVGWAVLVGDVPGGVRHVDIAQSIAVGGADGQRVEGVAWREDASQQCGVVDGPEHGGSCRIGGADGIGRDRERPEVVAGADDEQQVVGVGQPVEYPSNRAHPAHERSGLRTDGEVDDAHARRDRTPTGLSFDDSFDRAVQQIGEQPIREDLLVSCHELVGSHDGPDIQWPVKRFAVSREVTVDDQGGHRGAVVARGQRVVLAEPVGVVDYQPAGEGIVAGKRQPVQKGDPGQTVGALSRWQADLADRFCGRWCDAHGSERVDEHDFVGGQQPDRRGPVGQQRVNLLDRQLREQGVVADLADLGAVEHTAATAGDDLLDVCLCCGSQCGVAAVPQLDFDHHRADGLTDDVEFLLPLLTQAGLSDAIFWSPPSDRGELLERVLELPQAVGERR